MSQQITVNQSLCSYCSISEIQVHKTLEFVFNLAQNHVINGDENFHLVPALMITERRGRFTVKSSDGWTVSKQGHS